jgi:hypothetical protein
MAKETPQEAPRPIERLSPEDLTMWAEGLAKGQVFTGNDCPPDLLAMVFMPLGMGALSGQQIDWDSIGNVVQWISKAGPQGINGLPVFMSCHIIHKDDWTIIADRALKAHEALQAALKGE